MILSVIIFLTMPEGGVRGPKGPIMDEDTLLFSIR